MTFSTTRKKNVKPLSLDGLEGREFQRLLTQGAVEKCLCGDYFSKQVLDGCDADFQTLVRGVAERSRFIEFLLNEFASVIDAEGIRRNADTAAGYIARSRDSWQMLLPTRKEREAVLYIHDVYCQDLDKSERISMDQMIGELDRYLMFSPAWRQLRSRPTDRKAFDLIFVDEFHFFNKTEASILHNLFTEQQDSNNRFLPLIMAYDLKQSPTDAAINAGGLFKAAKVGETEPFELNEVFRSHQEIAAFLSDLDGSFPAYAMSNDWARYPAPSRTAVADGGEPRLEIFNNDLELIDKVFNKAYEDAKRIGGRNVAVLCLNDKLFSTYIRAGRQSIAGRFIGMKSRDDIGELKYVRRKFVFSMPQYVSGLQFKSVYLIHIDREDLPDTATMGERRIFVTKFYMAASRAIERLHISSSKQRLGPSEILNGPLARGTLKHV